MGSKLHPVKTSKYRKILSNLDWKYDRVKGDHEIWVKEGVLFEIVFITNDKEVQPFIIRQNNKTLGLSTDEFLALL